MEDSIESLNESIMHLFLISNQVRIQHLWDTHMLYVLYFVYMIRMRVFRVVQKMPVMRVKIHWQGEVCCSS